MSELVCCRRQRPLDDTKLSKTALFCFVLGVAIVTGEGISRSLGLFNVKKCETRVFKPGCAGNLPNAHGLGCSWESLFLQGLEKVTVKTLRPFLPHSPCWGRACVIQVCRFLPPLSANRARAQGTPGSALPCLLGLCCSRVDCPGCPTPAGFLRPVLPQPEEGLYRVREENLPKTLESKGPQILTKHFLGNSTLVVFSGQRPVQCGLINLFNTVPAHFWPHSARLYPIALQTISSSSYVSSLTSEAGRRHTLLSRLCGPSLIHPSISPGDGSNGALRSTCCRRDGTRA